MFTGATLVGDELEEELRCETRVNMLVFECWKKPSMPWGEMNIISSATSIRMLCRILHAHMHVSGVHVE